MKGRVMAARDETMLLRDNPTCDPDAGWEPADCPGCEPADCPG